MDVIASTAFGIQVDSQKNPDDPTLDYAKEIMGSKRYKSRIQRLKPILRILLLGNVGTAFKSLKECNNYVLLR